MEFSMRPSSRLTLALAASLAALLAARPAAAQSSGIVAVVDGDVITKGDVDNRGRLLALSTGLQVTPEVLDRLRSQTTRQLIDERLRLQEVQRRHIVVSDKEIAEALHNIEQRNGMQANGMRDKLAGSGVDLRTLIDQLRVQIGWTDVIRQQLGQESQITQAEIADQQRLLEQQTGKPEYRVSEIFVPVDDPANAADAQRFADAVIQQLRGGAPFPVVAAQFSQSQTALQGGDLGWVQPKELDPEVARIVEQMPIGAISNPIRVPGGFSVVTVRAKREIGHDIGTILSLRQVFLPFTAPLNPEAPTDQQKQTLEKARGLSSSLKSCDQVEQAAKAINSPRATDPGEVRLETINPPQFRATLAALPDNKPTQPLVASDGIVVMMICSRAEKNLAVESKEDIANRLIGERVELLSRQLLRDLHRKALIDVHGEKQASR
jgi:peptidyl-prolyl cis-trans isomerase SurA